MERAKKMVLISKEQLERIQREGGGGNNSATNNTTSDNPINSASTTLSLQSAQTPGDNLSRLDDQLRKILDSNIYANDHDRLKDYLKTLQRYLFFVEDKRSSLTPKQDNDRQTISNGISDSVVVQSVPKLYQKKAQLLLNHLKNNSDRIRWGENGVVYIDGEKIPNSNIVDLVNDACRNRKNIKPTGRKEFATILNNIATPREFIGNPEIWELSNSPFSRKKHYLKDDYEDESDTTPLVTTNNNSFSDLSNTIVKATDSSKKKRSGKKSFKFSTPLKKKILEINQTLFG